MEDVILTDHSRMTTNQKDFNHNYCICSLEKKAPGVHTLDGPLDRQKFLSKELISGGSRIIMTYRPARLDLETEFAIDLF
jgi:hypothetical protein